MYCLNCGELWHDCICVPWCWEHDSIEPCRSCVQIQKEKAEKEAMIAPFLIPWYKNILKYFTGFFK